MPVKSGIGVKHTLGQRIGYLIAASFDRLSVMAKQRGYWQESDGSPVAAADAQEVWATHAYDALTETARTYHAVITYRDLGKKVQEESGIRTTALLQNWIGLVLGKVMRLAHSKGEPPLTSLVVHADNGMVGVGYGEVLEVIGEPPLDEERTREEHAANRGRRAIATSARDPGERRMGGPVAPAAGGPQPAAGAGRAGPAGAVPELLHRDPEPRYVRHVRIRGRRGQPGLTFANRRAQAGSETWACTMRQPWGSRIHVWDWRPSVSEPG